MESLFFDFTNQWLRNVATDLTRYAVFSIGVWVMLSVLLAGVMARRKIRPDRPLWQQMAKEFLFSLRSVAIFSTVGLAPYVLEKFDLLHNPEMAAQWGPVWFWVSLVLMIVAHDAYFYWVHRVIHDPRLFRTFHRRHHLSHNPSPFTAYSFDVGEAFMMAVFVPIWVVIIPTPWPAVGLFVVHQIIRNTLGHCGYEVMPSRKDGRPLFDWMTTTTHHDLHHAQAGYNYGLYFTWWDRMMATEHPDYLACFAKASGRTMLPASA